MSLVGQICGSASDCLQMPALVRCIKGPNSHYRSISQASTDTPFTTSELLSELDDEEDGEKAAHWDFGVNKRVWNERREPGTAPSGRGLEMTWCGHAQVHAAETTQSHIGKATLEI